MGVFEFDRLPKGTEAITYSLTDITKTGATTIIGGGDSSGSCGKGRRSRTNDHISTGGGLEVLEGKGTAGYCAPMMHR